MKDPGPARALALALALPQLVVGLWAVLAPRSWYDDFPGVGPALAAAEPPFNRHLTTDAGAGFLAIGVLLAVAAWTADRAHLRLAAVGYLVFGVPHLIYHAAHPSPLLPASSDVLNVVLLSAEALAAVVLFLIAPPRKVAP